MRHTWIGCGAVFLAVIAAAAPAAGMRYADVVHRYTWGNGEAGYDDPSGALGRPERMTGEGTAFAAQVEPTNPPWLTSEIVSVGPDGGELVLGFNAPVLNDRGDGYQADLIVFGNTFFTGDFSNWPDVYISTPAATNAEPGKIEVSQDAATWYEVPGVFADSLWPTLGYVGADGVTPTNFWEPMDPSLTLADFDGLSLAGAAALYGTSGGGAPVDIADAVDAQGGPAGLDWIAFIRVTVPAGETYSTEVDGVAVVPEPATLGVVALGSLMTLWRRRR